MQSFSAFYEDAAKAEAAACLEGYNGVDGSLMDYIEPSDYRTGKKFQTITEAEGLAQNRDQRHENRFRFWNHSQTRVCQQALSLLHLPWGEGGSRLYGR
jgi:hypothetical protein